ncbi:MAG: polyisoprenoid-binding protein YceI [Alphaproteobacteria bacterium]|jgi:polyisoprenoid-binding protein YceI
MIKGFESKVTKIKSLGLFMLLFIASASVFALQSYEVDSKGSKVGFSGTHLGMQFYGEFETWQAKLVLPPQSNPSITATFDLTKAKTGDFIYDSTLVEGDWFDVEKHPQGSFVSDVIEVVEGGYKVSGKLTLRGVAKIQSFILTQSGNKLTAEFPINRLEYGIGLDSDPKGEWVSKDITMRLDLSLD